MMSEKVRCCNCGSEDIVLAGMRLEWIEDDRGPFLHPVEHYSCNACQVRAFHIEFEGDYKFLGDAGMVGRRFE